MPAIGFGQSISNEVNANHATPIMLHQSVSDSTRQTQEEKCKEDDDEVWTSPKLRMFYEISLCGEMRWDGMGWNGMVWCEGV